MLVRISLALVLVSFSFATSASKQPEALERYELSTLSYWSRAPKECAYIMDEDKYIHLVCVGSYLGKNHGRIISITSRQIELTELVPNAEEGYVERKVVLSATGYIHPE